MVFAFITAVLLFPVIYLVIWLTESHPGKTTPLLVLIFFGIGAAIYIVSEKPDKQGLTVMFWCLWIGTFLALIFY